MPSLDPPKYWRSLEERNGEPNPAWEGREFPEGAADAPEGETRRDFLKLLGGTAALAGIAGCANPPDKVLPYAKQPVEIIPGNPLHYATTFSRDGFARGMVVAAREGRPIKVEGNPEHPDSLGASDTYDQAQVWHLYDPQRAKLIREGSKSKAWARFVADMAAKSIEWKKDGGAKLRFLVEPSGSPVEADLRKQIQSQYPNARFYAWAPVNQDGVYGGTQLAFGRPLEVRYDFKTARAILALDSDFLAQGPGHVRYQRDWAEHRVPENELNRTYVVESGLTATGTSADHRLRVKPSEILDVAVALANALAPGKVPADRAGRFANDAWIKAAAKDLKSRGAAGVVVVGQRQSAAVHAVAAMINHALGSKCVSYSAPVLSDLQAGPQQLKALADEVKAGKVDTLVVTAYNPAYTAPADIDVAAMLRGTNTIYRGYFEDETARHCNWFLPATHELEEWGDGRGVDGTIALKQPLIHPLFNGISTIEIWAAILGNAARGAMRIVRDAWKARANQADFDKWWDHSVQKGVIADSALPPETVSPTGDLGAALAQVPRTTGAGLELNFTTDGKVHDGRYADCAWLQELPQSTNKMCWGNVVEMSPATAIKLGLKTEDLVEVTAAGKTITLPAYVLPGHADDTLSIAIGYGRQGAEVIGREIGTNAQPLRGSANPWFTAGAQITATGVVRKLSITHDHWSQEGRPIALDVDADELDEKTKAKKLKLPLIEENKGEQPSLYAPYEYTGFKWGMAIDMGKCTGCNACVVACESENNVLVVGADQVRKGRDMHWIRIDRYFTGEDTNPDTIMQPLMCVHCENAPCEYVCPVNATVHSDEGLNEMVYNRCVGTRYCSNNCPYKVRRFNYLNWHNNLQGTEEMAMNPDVTVRARGVMEKCTYCVQRIERYRIDKRIHNKGIEDWKDGDIQSACSQACPSNAIVFGSLHDAKAEVSKLHAEERGYQLLHELGTRPRTIHLARVRNKNPEITNG